MSPPYLTGPGVYDAESKHFLINYADARSSRAAHEIVAMVQRAIIRASYYARPEYGYARERTN